MYEWYMDRKLSNYNDLYDTSFSLPIKTLNRLSYIFGNWNISCQCHKSLNVTKMDKLKQSYKERRSTYSDF